MGELRHQKAWETTKENLKWKITEMQNAGQSTPHVVTSMGSDKKEISY